MQLITSAMRLPTPILRRAREAGYLVHRIAISQLEFPLLRTKEAFEEESVPLELQQAQRAIQ